jgi:ABC-2 type transport system permease protein
MKKYWRLFKAFVRTSFIADLEFRANFATRILTDIFWYLAQIITFEALYLHTERIGSWDVHQTRVFLGILFVVDATFMIFFHDNLERMDDAVRKGELDLLLAKPVNSQFMLSLRRTATALTGNFLIGSAWLIFALSNLPDLNLWRLLWLLLFVPCGALTFYAFKFLFGSFAVIFTRSENLKYVWYQLYKLALRPESIYAPWLKFLLMTVFPLSFIASVPARAVLEPANPLMFLWVVAWTAFVIYLSNRFWRFALKFYSSASS